MPDFLPFFMDEDEYENEHETTPLMLRTRQYWSVLSGAYLGSFFGNNPIWCFGESNPSSALPCRIDKSWKTELGSAGSVGQSWFGKLFRSREHWRLVPDIRHTVVTAGYGSGSSLTTTARTSDGQTIIAYVPNGNRTVLAVDISKITSASQRAKCWWFNPSSGLTTLVGNVSNLGTRDFTPPDSNDWVLVIDDGGANLAAPGVLICDQHCDCELCQVNLRPLIAGHPGANVIQFCGQSLQNEYLSWRFSNTNENGSYSWCPSICVPSIAGKECSPQLNSEGQKHRLRPFNLLQRYVLG